MLLRNDLRNEFCGFGTLFETQPLRNLLKPFAVERAQTLSGVLWHSIDSSFLHVLVVLFSIFVHFFALHPSPMDV